MQNRLASKTNRLRFVHTFVLLVTTNQLTLNRCEVLSPPPTRHFTSEQQTTLRSGL